VQLFVRCRGFDPLQLELALQPDAATRVQLQMVSVSAGTAGAKDCSTTP
jgi:hypothetical protein